jgi:cytidine deaminase
MAEVARQAGVQHWAPYSNFPVVAAVETIDGKIYGGSNVENASYTLTTHAEANAIHAALAGGSRQRCGNRFIRTVYVSCPGGDRIGPCGLGRQSIYEFATDDCVVVGQDPETGNIAQDTLAYLLPKAFGPADLGVE